MDETETNLNRITSAKQPIADDVQSLLNEYLGVPQDIQGLITDYLVVRDNKRRQRRRKKKL